MIKVRINPVGGSTADAIIASAQARIRRQGEVTGQDMVDEVTSIVRADFFIDRPLARRRNNDIRLVNAFRFVVTEEPGRVVSTLTIKKGVNEKKVATLNNGSRDHDITPRNKSILVMPTPSTPFNNAYGTAERTVALRVHHPGRDRRAPGTQFMQRARAKAVARLR